MPEPVFRAYKSVSKVPSVEFPKSWAGAGENRHGLRHQSCQPKLCASGNPYRQVGFSSNGAGRKPTEHGRGLRAKSSLSLVDTAPAEQFAELQARLVEYASRIGELMTPNDVLDGLHCIVSKSLPLSVLGAARFP